MPTPSKDFYEILQIHHKAEPEIVRAAYQRLVQKYHPDKNLDYTADTDECMKKISEAYAVLKDPERRAAYDRKAGYSGGASARENAAGAGEAAGGKADAGPAPKSGGTDRARPDAGAAGGGRAETGAGTGGGGRARPETAARAGGGGGARPEAAARPGAAKAAPPPGGRQGGADNSSSGRRTGWITEKAGYAKAARPGGHARASNRKHRPKTREGRGMPNVHGLDPGKVEALQRAAAERLGLPVFFRRRLADGGEGPVMAVLPQGSFLMGSPAGFLGFGGEKERDAGEGPQHRVTLAVPFAIGRFAVTFAEYDRFCEATNRPLPSDEGWGRGRRPAVNVDWHDAKAYCRWLSKQTGKIYRLPSEAEWEYACRAGSATAFWWSGDITPTAANYNGQYAYNRGDKGRFRGKTLPVDEFRPNAFGLYQTSGNVWEWCEDDWHKNYKGAPADGGPWIAPERGALRVVRGGAWASLPAWLRSAYRTSGEAAGRYDNQGFRIAETLVSL